MTSTTQGLRFGRFLARDRLATQSRPLLHECGPSIGPSSASPPLRIDGGERLRWVYCCSRVGFWSLYLKFVGGLSRFDNRPLTEMDAKSEPGWRGRTKELTSVLFVAHAARAGVSRIKWLVAFSEINGGRCHVKTCDFVACPPGPPSFLCPPPRRRQVPVSGVISETVTIAASEWRAYRVTLGSQDSFQFSIYVKLGSDIDVYTMPASGYSEYTNPSAPSFGYLTSGTRENTQSFGTRLSPSSGTAYLVVDNIDVSSSGAPGSAPVTVDVSAQIRPFPI